MKRILCTCIGFLIVSVFVLSGCSPQTPAEGEQRELYVLQYGGKYEDVLRANAIEFEEKYNAKVIFVPGSAMDAVMKVRNKEVDVAFMDPIYAFRGEKEGVWERLDSESVPNLDNLYNVARLSDYTVAHDLGCFAIAYNPKFVKEAPTSWCDLWNPDYKDKITMTSLRADTMELMVLMAKLGGGDERNIDPGFEKMVELVPNIHTWYTEHAQCLDLLRNEEVWLALWSDGRVVWAKDEGVEVEIAVPEEGGFAQISTMNVVAGRPNKDLALAYVNFELDKQAQLNMAKELGYFPPNKTVQLPPDVQEKCAFTPENVEKVQMADWMYVEGVMDEWNERWEKDVLGAGK